MKNILNIKYDSERIFGLDILRALAILFVIIEHGTFLLPHTPRIISRYFVFDGVSIFFVLSGFLIGGILIKSLEKNKLSLKLLMQFWTRRWFRTLPNYFLILLLLGILNYFFTVDFNFKSIFPYFIFSQNIIQSHPLFFPEAWSLSIEEWFYLLVPIMLFTSIWAFKLKPKNAILLIAIIIILFVTLFRLYRHIYLEINNFEDWDAILRKQVITRLDSLMFGVIAAYIHFYHFKIWINHKVKLLIIGISLILLNKFVITDFVEINSLYSNVFSFTFISFSTILLLPFLSVLKSGKGILVKPITYISIISYSMYLLNSSVIQWWIITKLPWNLNNETGDIICMINYFVFWALVIILSILMYKYFEIPMTKLRDNKTIKKWLNI